ncbi:MAG: alpha/beta fold hydrolase [Pseudomonadota bacterium]
MLLSLPHLAFDAQDPETAPPLLIAHGLFGQGRNFQSIAKRLATNRRVISVDMRNHGTAPWSDLIDYPSMAGDLAESIRTDAGGPVILLGHSMGGKAAMALALAEPELLCGLIVADIAPIGYGHSHIGYVAAMQAVDVAGVARRSDVDRQLAETVPDRNLRAFLLQSLSIQDGSARWRLNLAALSAEMPNLVGFPDRFPYPAYDGPTLFLRGGKSDYVPPDSEAKIRRLFPAAEIQTLEGAGHWLHAEQPEAFTGALAAWLDRL